MMKTFSLILLLAYFCSGYKASLVDEDDDIKEIAQDKFRLLQTEIQELNKRAEIPSKYPKEIISKKSKRKNIPLFPDVSDSVIGHPIVHAYVSDRPEKPALKKTVIPAGKNVVYDIHDGPNDSYQEVDHDVNRRFELYPKWFSQRVPSLFGKHFAKRYYHPFGSIQNRAQISHHRVKTATGSRRQFSHVLPESWLHAPNAWPDAPHDFQQQQQQQRQRQRQRQIDINETPKEFMEMQSGHIAPMNAHATQPINLSNAVGDLVDIPDGETSGLDDDLKEIPHTLMNHLNPDTYEPPNHGSHYSDHWTDYTSLPHHHHHHHSMNPCHQSPCLNGGVCHFVHHDGDHNPYSFKCNCGSGYKGHYCEHIPFSCHPNPCKHGGLCTHQQNSYFCTCPQDYKGHDCEVASACLHGPCFNGGQCVETTDGFYCECNGGFTGRNCNEKVSLCANNPCQNGGTCREFGEEQRFECTCPKGFACVDCTCPVSSNSIPLSSPAITGSQPASATLTASLTVNTQTCPENQCKNGGSCIKSSNTFSCNCPTGFHGLDCATPDLCNPNPCENNGVCVQDGDENYKCVCPYGFKGADCQTPLACSAHPCMNSATCVETPEGYHCRCTTGYKGRKCTELSPCSRNPCMHKSTCLEKGPMYTCTCKTGYRGKNCREKDPCLPNPCQNGLCGEISGVTSCNCTHGWMGDSCEIENKCQENHCLNGATCVHTLEDFRCICPEGYHGTSCEFRSPCHINPCQNGGICEAAGGTYVCRCGAGFHGERCHLSSHCHPNPCHNSGHCYDGDDDYVCECPPSYYGKTCFERHTCFSNPCMNGAQCIEMEESFHCKCRLGYYGRLCEDNICNPHPCRNGGTCMASNNDIGYACECKYPYHGHKCDETDPCVPNPCKNAGTCHSHLQRIQDVNYHVGPTFHGQDENVVSVVGPIYNTTVHRTPFYDTNSHSMNYLPDANMQTNEVNHFHLTSDHPKKVYEDQLYHARINNGDGDDDDNTEKSHDINDEDNSDHHSGGGHVLELPKKHDFLPSNSEYHVEEYPEDEHSNIRAMMQQDYDAEKRTFGKGTKRHRHHRRKIADSSKRSSLLHHKLDRVPQVMILQRNSTTSQIVKRTIHDLYVCQCFDGYLGAHCQRRS